MLPFAVCESRHAEAPLTLDALSLRSLGALVVLTPSSVLPGVAQPALQRHRETGECPILPTCLFRFRPLGTLGAAPGRRMSACGLRACGSG
jgi:hypothetical protein